MSKLTKRGYGWAVVKERSGKICTTPFPSLNESIERYEIYTTRSAALDMMNRIGEKVIKIKL